MENLNLPNGASLSVDAPLPDSKYMNFLITTQAYKKTLESMKIVVSSHIIQPKLSFELVFESKLLMTLLFRWIRL